MAYGTIRMHQENRFPGRISGTDLANSRQILQHLARSFGAYAERVSSTEEFAAAFERAVDSKTARFAGTLCGSKTRSLRAQAAVNSRFGSCGIANGNADNARIDH